MSNLIKNIETKIFDGKVLNYITDGGNSYVINLNSNPLANCQICSISLIEDCLSSCKDNSFVLSVIKKLSYGQKNLVLMDINQTYLGRMQDIFGKYINSTTLFESTNGSQRAFVLIRNPNSY